MDSNGSNTTRNISISLVVVAAGASSRMRDLCKGKSKVLLNLEEKIIVLELTLKNLLAANIFSNLVVVARPEDHNSIKGIMQNSNLAVSWKIVDGGETRQESVYNGILALPEDTTHIAIHDGARPFCEPTLVKTVVEQAVLKGAAILAVPATATLKRVNPESLGNGETIERTILRTGVWLAQTPQVFSKEVIEEAYQRAEEDNYTGTDDSELAERLGVDVYIVDGSPLNIKITTPEDLAFSRALIRVLKEEPNQFSNFSLNEYIPRFIN